MQARHLGLATMENIHAMSATALLQSQLRTRANLARPQAISCCLDH